MLIHDTLHVHLRHSTSASDKYCVLLKGLWCHRHLPGVKKDKKYIFFFCCLLIWKYCLFALATGKCVPKAAPADIALWANRIWPLWAPRWGSLWTWPLLAPAHLQKGCTPVWPSLLPSLWDCHQAGFGPEQSTSVANNSKNLGDGFKAHVCCMILQDLGYRTVFQVYGKYKLTKQRVLRLQLSPLASVDTLRISRPRSTKQCPDTSEAH